MDGHTSWGEQNHYQDPKLALPSAKKGGVTENEDAIDPLSLFLTLFLSQVLTVSWPPPSLHLSISTAPL